MGPKVSIGLPVYNGEAYVAAAIESLLTQTYGNVELVISDNASTDRTEAICREYANRDQRITYVRHPVNKGAAANFNYVATAAQGKYFKWASHDDVCAPAFIARCVEVLERDSSVVLCTSKVRHIDSAGQYGEVYQNPCCKFDDPAPDIRFAEMVLLPHACYEVFGVIRSDVLRETKLIGPYMNSDRTLLAELALHGKFHELPEALFISRDHAGRSVKLHPHARHVWFDSARTRSMHFPYWRMVKEYLSCVARTPLPKRVKVKCYGHVVRWAGASWRLLRGDIRRAPGQAFAIWRAQA